MVLMLVPAFACTTSSTLLMTKVSLPVPPINVDRPVPAMSVSLPAPPLKVSLPALPVITLFSALPVPVRLAVPVRTRFCTLAASVTLTDDCTVLRLVPVDCACTTSSVLLMTKVSLPVPPTKVASPTPAIRVSLPLPATSRSLPALPVSTLFRLLPVAVRLAVPVSVRFCAVGALVASE